MHMQTSGPNATVWALARSRALNSRMLVVILDNVKDGTETSSPRFKLPASPMLAVYLVLP